MMSMLKRSMKLAREVVVGDAIEDGDDGAGDFVPVRAIEHRVEYGRDVIDFVLWNGRMTGGFDPGDEVEIAYPDGDDAIDVS